MKLANFNQTIKSVPVIIFACAFLLATFLAGLTDIFTAPASITSGLLKSQEWMLPLIDALFMLLAGICATYLVAKLVLKRAEAQDKLQSEKNKLETVVDTMGHSLTIQDKDYTITYQNKPSQLASGGNHVGEKCYKAYVHKEGVCEGCPVEQAFKDGKSHTVERNGVKPSGEVIFWENTASPIRDSNGDIVSCLEIAQDITERKKAEQAMADEATRRRILIEQSRDGIVILDESGKVYDANQCFAEMLGYTPEEARELHVWDWDTQWSRGQLLEMIQNVGESGDHFETYHRRKDGTAIDVEISTNGAICEGQKLVFCVCRDVTERKHMEDELQSEKNKLQSVVDALEYGLTIQDKDYNIIYQNKPSQKPFGAHLGEKCYRVYAGRDEVCEGCPVEQSFKDGKSHTVERERVLPSGEVIFWENTASPIRDSNGNIVSCLEITRNITERKRVEEALQESQEALRKMFESVTEGISVIDLNGVITEVNQRTVEIHGFSSKDEILGKNAFDLVAPKDHKRIADNMRQALKQGTISGVEYTLLKADGTKFPAELSTSVLKDAAGKVIGHITIARDVTKRKQMEELFKTVTNSSPVGIYIVQDKKFILANPRFQKLTGYSEEELLGMDSLGLVLPEDREAVRKKAVKMLKGERSSPYQFRVIHKSGSARWVMETVTSIQYRGRRAILGNYMDITERRQTEEKIQQQNEFLNNILDALTHPFYVLDANDYTIKMGNLATKAGNLLENPTCYALTHKTDKPCRGADHICPLEEVKRTKKPVVVEHIHYDEDDNARNIEVHGYPIFDNDGNVVQMIEYSLDITERKRAEEALRESEEFRSSLLANSPNPIGVINPDSSLKYVNPALEKLTGFSAAELIGKKAPYPYWTQDTLKKTTISFRKAMRQGDQRAEELFQKKSGERFWVKITSTPVMNNGDFKYLLTNWVDITKRKQVEEALRQSEKKYKNLAEATSDLIWEADEKGTFTFVSPRIKDILGYEASEVASKMRTLDLTPKKEAKKWLKRLKEITAKKEAFFGFEVTHLHKNGAPVILETSGIPTFDSEGNFKGYVGVNKDITERKQAEEKIRNAAEEWRTTFDSIIDFISIHDKDNRIVRVNKAFAEAFKTTPDKLVGRLCHELSHDTQVPPEKCPHRQTMETGKPATMEAFDANRGIYTQESTSPIFDGKGKVIGSVHISKNITEHKRMEEQLMLTDRLASIGELASGIAHELNNPLTSVIGFSQLLLEEDIPENLKEDLGTIYSEAQRASAIVKNLLTFARKHAPMRQISQVNNILEDVLKLRAYEHKVNNIELEKNFALELPEIMLDYFQMQQVFLNLIVNAESAMLEANGKGKLAITTGRVNNTIKVSIADNGPGIAKENLRRVFDPFFTTKEVGKGTGLGLSICHGIVAGHGGRIYAEGEVKQGAKFVVELPLNGNST